MPEEPQKTPEELIEGMEAAQKPVSRADVKQEFSAQPSGSSNAVPIAAIIAGSVIVLGCIIACAVVAYAFMINAPW